MVHYRAYLIGQDGRFIKVVAPTCFDDEAAVNAAMKFVNGQDVEVWHHDRKVAKLPHQQ
jgi:hypothetical protein